MFLLMKNKHVKGITHSASNVMTTKYDITCLTGFFQFCLIFITKRLLSISCETSDRDGHYFVEVQIIANVDCLIDFMKITN